MAYAIRLSSKHTGETIYLGSVHRTQEEAEQYIAEQVCTRCNSAYVYPCADDAQYISRDQPLGSMDQIREQRGVIRGGRRYAK